MASARHDGRFATQRGETGRRAVGSTRRSPPPLGPVVGVDTPLTAFEHARVKLIWVLLVLSSLPWGLPTRVIDIPKRFEQAGTALALGIAALLALALNRRLRVRDGGFVGLYLLLVGVVAASRWRVAGRGSAACSGPGASRWRCCWCCCSAPTGSVTATCSSRRTSACSGCSSSSPASGSWPGLGFNPLGEALDADPGHGAPTGGPGGRADGRRLRCCCSSGVSCRARRAALWSLRRV